MCGCYELNHKTIYPNENIEIYIIYHNKLCKISSLWGIRIAGHQVINARSETVMSKACFKDLMHCIIKADSYIEWDDNHHKAILSRKDHKPIYMAGLMTLSKNPNHVIITTLPNQSVIPIHDRMPLILESHQVMDWLNNMNTQSILSSVPRELNVFRNLEQLSLF